MCTKSMMASQGKQVVMLASGTVVAVAAAIFVQYARGIIRRKSREKLEQHIDDYISLEDLGALALHAPQVNLRRSAEQVVLDRAARPQYFSHILKCCLNNDDEESVLKSITVLCVILKNVNFKELPDERKILSVLGTCFMRSIHQQKYKKQCKDVFLKQRVQSRLAGVMFDIICDMDERKMMLIWETEGILATILNEMQTTESKEVMRYCLFIVHQLCLCDGLVPELVESDCVPIICGMVVNYWGDTVIQRIGLQMLVLIINTQGIDEKKILAEIASHNVVMHAVVCLKSEENVLVYWAVALLHEFAVNEVLRDNICKLPYLMKSLQKALYGGQAGLQRLVLRVICFLALRNEPFKLEVLACNRILSRIPICLSSGDKDVVHWALVLTHDLAMIGKAAVEMLLSSCDGILQAMTPLANSPDSVLVRLLAETLWFLLLL
ncbi:uncharacterized protein [Ptychodera flava]|uniref:uncharacterized protein n=1 Tax=Ptychodera flava TaxID=63121 RepID=UPI00396A96A8